MYYMFIKYHLLFMTLYEVIYRYNYYTKIYRAIHEKGKRIYKIVWKENRTN